MKTIFNNDKEQEFRMYFEKIRHDGSMGGHQPALLPMRASLNEGGPPSSGKWKFVAAFLAVVFTAALFAPVQAQQETAEYRHVLEQGTTAGIDAERLEGLIVRAQQRGVSPDQLQSMVGPAIALANDDLPYLPVLQKVLEGMAKRVPAGSILIVTQNMAGGITRSAEIVDPWMARNEVRTMTAAVRGDRDASASAREYRRMFIEHASYAFQQNTDEQTVRDYLDQSVTPGVVERNAIASVAAGLRALPEMPITQDDPVTSIRLLVRALNAGFSPAEIQQLPDAFRSAQFHSELPADRVARGLDHQLGENIPAAHILENLFQGNVGGGPPGFIPPGLERRDERGSDRARDRRPPTPPPFE